jgi:hypothetical protein
VGRESEFHMSLMLYRRGGDEKVHGVDCETRVVDGPDEEEAARADGFASYGEVIAGQAGKPPPVDNFKESAGTGRVAELEADLRASAELLSEVQIERDEARDKLADAQREIDALKAQIAPFDGDSDGKPGGRKKLGIKAEAGDGGES